MTENININDVDFFNFDIERYLDWLEHIYLKLSSIYTLPYLDDKLTNTHLRKYLYNSHRIRTRGESTPKKINKLYDTNIRELSIEVENLKELLVYILNFKSCKDIKSKPCKENKYILYSKKQVENININSSQFIFWRSHLDGWLDDFIDEFNNEIERKPITESKIIEMKIRDLKSETLKHFDSIINGYFIGSLDEFSDSFEFFTEVSHLQKIAYLEIRLKGENPKHEITKPLKWNASKNILPTILLGLYENNIITGSKENLKRIIVNNFIDSNNKDFSMSTLTDICKASTGKLSTKITDSLSELIKDIKK